MSFALYTVGYVILIAGLAYQAHLMHMPEHYIVKLGGELFWLELGWLQVCRALGSVTLVRVVAIKWLAE